MEPNTILRKGERTRQTIMDAAGRVFLRDGYLNADSADIAREAGKSIGTFYIYFKNKADLLEAMIAAFTEDAFARFGLPQERVHDPSGPEDWELVIKNVWQVFKRHAPTFYALSQAALIEPQFAAEERKLRDRARADFAGFIKYQQKIGLCKGLHAGYAAAALEMMVLNALHEWIGGAGNVLSAREEAKARTTLVRMFTAVLKDS
jgi:AcrR family transcriptional regulator